jgi:hypothetical protein
MALLLKSAWPLGDNEYVTATPDARLAQVLKVGVVIPESMTT